MTLSIRPCFAAALCLCAHFAVAEVSFETLTFIESDGHTYTNYATTRSDGDRYTVFLDPNERLADFLYINPNRYEFAQSTNGANLLEFDQGSYALINRGNFIDFATPNNSAVTIDDEGIYHLRTWDGKKQANGHYGFWNSPDAFGNFAAAWIIPEQFEVTDYQSNRPGEWVKRGNTLAFFAKQVNNIVFEIAYRRLSTPRFQALREHLQDNTAVELQQIDDGIKVILTNSILFPSGSAILSAPGKQLIKDVVDNLQANAEYRVVVEGHTDNIPIRGALSHRFASNWELSAQRALNVLHTLESAGIDPGRLQARAFGPYQPRKPNDSDANRSSNRRIELMIEPI